MPGLFFLAFLPVCLGVRDESAVDIVGDVFGVSLGAGADPVGAVYLSGAAVGLSRVGIDSAAGNFDI